MSSVEERRARVAADEQLSVYAERITTENLRSWFKTMQCLALLVGLNRTDNDGYSDERMRQNLEITRVNMNERIIPIIRETLATFPSLESFLDLIKFLDHTHFHPVEQIELIKRVLEIPADSM